MNPLSLKNDVQNGYLVLQWDTGLFQRITHRQLRASCPCAKCRAGRMQGYIALVDVDVQVKAVHNMVYGVQLVFSDGHDRGIYPWAFLRELPQHQNA